MPGSESRFYRRQPGVGWLLTVIAVPLLLAFIGWSVSSRAEQSAAVLPPATSPPAAAAAPPAAPLGAMSIVRSGNGFTLTGQMPDAASKASLLQALRQALPGAKILDELPVAPGVASPEFAGLGGLFGAALETSGFSANLRGGTVTLTGTASSAATRAAAADAAKATWPNTSVVNDIGLTTGA